MTKITVTSAAAISDEQKLRLEKYFAQKYGDFYNVEYIINDAIIGGIIIFDGDMVYNGSISGQLQRLRDSLLGMDNE